MDAPITIALPNGYKLVAAQNPDPDYGEELFIGVEDLDGRWHQDLAVVRSKYSYDSNGRKIVPPEEFEVLVYGNKDCADYTDQFTIGLYEGEN